MTNTRTEYRYTAMAMALDLAMAQGDHAAKYAAIYGETWISMAERYGNDGFGVLGQEIEAAFTRITDPTMSAQRMADAGQTGVI